MKSTSSRFAAALAAVALLTVPAARPQQDKPKVPSAPAKTITGAGCVEPGVEASCLVLKDVKTGALYNLIISGKKPAVGTAIRFAGTRFDGMTVCMQGQPVKVSKWTAKGACKLSPEK